MRLSLLSGLRVLANVVEQWRQRDVRGAGICSRRGLTTFWNFLRLIKSQLIQIHILFLFLQSGDAVGCLFSFSFSFFSVLHKKYSVFVSFFTFPFLLRRKLSYGLCLSVSPLYSAVLSSLSNESSLTVLSCPAW